MSKFCFYEDERIRNKNKEYQIEAVAEELSEQYHGREWFIACGIGLAAGSSESVIHLYLDKEHIALIPSLPESLKGFKVLTNVIPRPEVRM